MNPHVFRTFVLTALAFAAVPVAADAQIYSWRDADGNLVLSSTPTAGAATVKTYAVVNVPTGIRTTRAPMNRRAQEFEPIILQHASAHGVRPDLVRAVIQAESAFNVRARSPKGAMGLMQLMPGTAAELGVTDPWDPEQNIRGGVTYLSTLLAKYSQNEELALAAYNAGPAAVQKYGAVPPYRETRDYIARITNTAGRVTRAPARPLFRKVQLVDGREVTTFSTTPASEATRASRR